MTHLPKHHIIALDVGGTSIKSTLVIANGQLVGEAKTTPIDSQASADVILDALANIINDHIRELELVHDALLGVGLGFPGPFEYDMGISRIQGVAKFESLYGLNVRQGLQSRLNIDHLPIRFRNDAEAAIVGEARYGVGQPFARLIGVTLGTGCGSAFLVDGQPVTTGAGVPANGWLYPILWQGQQADDVFSIRGLMRALHQAGIMVSEIKNAAQLARQNHQIARQIFTQFGHNLGAFLRPSANTFQADAILLQGGIAQAFDLFEEALRAQLRFRQEGTEIAVLQGKLGAKAALLGAAALF